MNNSQVAHLWANQSKDYAKGSNFYFEGATIYSYGKHFPIAQIHGDTILFTNKNYSNTTSRHKSHVSRAIDIQKFKFIECPEVWGFTAKNDTYFKETIASLLDSFKRSRKKKEYIFDTLEHTIKQYKLHCEKGNFIVDENLLAYNKEEMIKAVEIEKEKREAEFEIQLQKLRIEKQEELNQFLNNDKKIKTVEYRNNTNYLKIVGEKCITNNGAEVDKFKVFILANAISFGVDKEKIIGSKIGNFRIDSFNEEGLKIGCHFFDTQEVNRIINLFGVKQNGN